jgi:hypothetical protein
VEQKIVAVVDVKRCLVWTTVVGRSTADAAFTAENQQDRTQLKAAAV